MIKYIKNTFLGLQNLDKVCLSYILFQTFFSLLLWIPIFFVFQIESGLEKQQIFFIQSLYYFVFCLFELPTGMIADKIGHRRAMIFGAAILMLSNLVPIFLASYLGFLIHFILIAAARSLISGSTSSYLFNYLDDLGRADEYKQVEGKARSLGLVVRVIIWPLSGPLMGFIKWLPYLLTAINSFIAMIFAFRLKDDLHLKNLDIDQEEIDSKWKLKELFSQITSSKMLIFFMIQGAGIFVLQRLCMIQLYQPLLKFQGFSLSSFGVMMSLATVFEALGAYQGYRLKKYFKDETTVFVMTAGTAFCFLIMIFPVKIVTVIGFALFSLFAGVAFPVQKQLLNDHIPNKKYRASILSIESLGDRMICSLASIIIGLAFKYGINVPTLFIAFFVAASLFLTVIIFMRKKLIT